MTINELLRKFDELMIKDGIKVAHLEDVADYILSHFICVDGYKKYEGELKPCYIGKYNVLNIWVKNDSK